MRPYLFIPTLVILVLFSCKKSTLSSYNNRNYRLTDSSYTYSWKGTGYTNVATISRTITVNADTGSYVIWGGNTYQKESSGHFRYATSETQNDLWLTDTTISLYTMGPASPGSAIYSITLQGVRM